MIPCKAKLVSEIFRDEANISVKELLEALILIDQYESFCSLYAQFCKNAFE